MNHQRGPRPVAPSGYPNQYSTNAFVLTPGVHPQYQHRPASFPYGQSQYIQPHAQVQTTQRLTMATANQPHLIHTQQHAGPSTAAQGPMIIRKRNNPEPMLNSGMQQAKKKRALDRNMPEKLDTLVPESLLYTELQNFEKRLDATIMRKRLEVQETINKPMKIKRTLRVFVSNTAINQNSQRDNESNDLGFGDNVPAWILKIEGRLLDPQNSSKTNKIPSRKFSSFFTSIIVDLDRDPEMYPDGNTIEWNKTNNTEGVDGFEIKRKGDTNVKCKIFLNLDKHPPRYKLSPELASLLGIKEETKTGVILALWQYIKHHNLQDNIEDKRFINNDARLEILFNCSRMAFPQIPELINMHLQPIDPITIDYTIRVDKEFHQSRYAYDIEVEVDDPNKLRLVSVFNNNTSQREIQNLDDKIVQCVQSINNSKTKRDFLLNFAKSPVEFINKWVASQSRDLEVILGESHVNLEEQRRSEFYKQSWVNEAVFHYATAQTQRKMHELLGSSSSFRNEQRR